LPKEVLYKLKNKVFIDGGAFWGDSMLMLQKYSPLKTICFEPNSVNFAKLQNVAASNNINVEISPLGLSNIKETLKMNYISNKQNHGASLVFSPYKAKTETISTTSLDAYLLPTVGEIGLIKLDVEGVGLNAIKGAASTIESFAPIISCAVYHNPEEIFEIVPQLAKYNNNYKFSILPLSQGFILKELTLLAWV